MSGRVVRVNWGGECRGIWDQWDLLAGRWEPDQVDEIQSVTTDEAMHMARRLAREGGLFAGASSGANVVAALRIAERLVPDATVVTGSVRFRAALFVY